MTGWGKYARLGYAYSARWQAEHNDLGWFILHGAVGGGIFAALAISLAEMIASMTMGQPVMLPMRMLAATVLGAEALDPGYPLMPVMLAGTPVHILISATEGVALESF